MKETTDVVFEHQKKVLGLETRKKIFEIVNKHPGTHFRELERLSKMKTGTVKYHLDYLARRGLITTEKNEANIRYFPQTFRSDNKALMSMLRQSSVRKILLIVLTHKNCNHEQIVKEVGLSPSTVSWHIKKLTNGNILGFVKKGRRTFYNILIDKEEILKLLITYKDSFVDALVDRTIDMWETH